VEYLDFVLYRARGKNGYLYDISMAPDVDFSILKRTRKIDRFEIISEKASLEECKKALDKIYSKPPLIVRFIGLREYFINSALKKYNLKRTAGKADSDEIIPDSSDISKVEDCITGRVVSLNSLLSFEKKFCMSKDNIIKSVQALYCMRRIKIMPAVKKEKNKISCSLCEKEPCQECCYGFKEDDILLYAANNYRLNCQHNVTVKKTKLTRILKNAEESVNEFLESKKNSAVVWCTSNAFDYSILGSGIADLQAQAGMFYTLLLNPLHMKPGKSLMKILKGQLLILQTDMSLIIVNLISQYAVIILSRAIIRRLTL
jgi:hypothetical protein